MMKNNVFQPSLLVAVLAAATVSMSCDDGPEPQNFPPPSVKLVPGEASSADFSFTLIPSDAVQAAYVVFEEGNAVPSAEKIMAEGHAADADTEKTYTQTGLEPDTRYVVAAAARGRYGYSEVVSIVMTTGRTPALPAVELTFGYAESDRIGFGLVPSHAECVGWICVPAGEPLPSASDIIRRGNRADASTEAEYEADGLEAETHYIIAAAASAGDVLSEVATLEVSTARWEPPYDIEILCSEGWGGYYRNDLVEASTGQYSLELSDIPYNDKGQAVGPGYKFVLSLHSDFYDDPAGAIPAEGVYRFDPTDSNEEFTFDDRYSSWLEADESGCEKGKGPILDGTLFLESDGQEYTIRLYVTLPGSERPAVKAVWKGPVEWADMTRPGPMDHDIQATFASAVYSGDKQSQGAADRWKIVLLDDPASPSIQLTLDLFTDPSPLYGDPELPAGAYTAMAGDIVPGRFVPGSIAGMEIYGTYLYTVVKGYKMVAFCAGGTVTVSRDGDGYTFDIDLTDRDGKNITGRYSGAFEVDDQSGRPGRPSGEITVNASHFWRGYYWGWSSSGWSGGGYQYYLEITDKEFYVNDSGTAVPVGGGPANKVTLELYAPSAPQDTSDPLLPDGTYTLAEEPGGWTCGTFSSCGYWDEAGNFTRIRFASGSVTTVRRSGHTYDLVVDMLTTDGKSFVCTYGGELLFEN